MYTYNHFNLVWKPFIFLNTLWTLFYVYLQSSSIFSLFFNFICFTKTMSWGFGTINACFNWIYKCLFNFLFLIYPTPISVRFKFIFNKISHYPKQKFLVKKLRNNNFHKNYFDPNPLSLSSTVHIRSDNMLKIH